jgi:HrpA-like RNA helicase
MHFAGKKAQLVREGWGDDTALQQTPLNQFYDSSLYQDYSKHVRVNLSRVDEGAIDFDLLEDLVLYIDAKESDGSILVFLPGMGEIVHLCSRLEANHQCAFVGLLLSSVGYWTPKTPYQLFSSSYRQDTSI